MKPLLQFFGMARLAEWNALLLSAFVRTGKKSALGSNALHLFMSFSARTFTVAPYLARNREGPLIADEESLR